jgi:hypothetical protein
MYQFYQIYQIWLIIAALWIKLDARAWLVVRLRPRGDRHRTACVLDFETRPTQGDADEESRVDAIDLRKWTRTF